MGRRAPLLLLLLLARPARAQVDDGLDPAWLPLGAGIVAGAAGALMLWQARVQYDLLTNPAGPALGAEGGAAAAGTGRVYQSAGWAAVGVGAAGVVAGTVALLWPRAPVAVVPVLGPGQAGVGVVGTFP